MVGSSLLLVGITPLTPTPAPSLPARPVEVRLLPSRAGELRQRLGANPKCLPLPASLWHAAASPLPKVLPPRTRLAEVGTPSRYCCLTRQALGALSSSAGAGSFRSPFCAQAAAGNMKLEGFTYRSAEITAFCSPATAFWFSPVPPTWPQCQWRPARQLWFAASFSIVRTQKLTRCSPKFSRRFLD